jgi:hypothetical protein
MIGAKMCLRVVGSLLEDVLCECFEGCLACCLDDWMENGLPDALGACLEDGFEGRLYDGIGDRRDDVLGTMLFCKV